MKTTIEIKGELLAQAKKPAKRSGRPLRAVVEDGLRLVLAESREAGRYQWRITATAIRRERTPSSP